MRTTAINIVTKDENLLNAIRSILALSPETKASFEHSGLSEDDEADLLETIRLDEAGELEYMSFKEFDKEIKEHLKKLGAVL